MIIEIGLIIGAYTIVRLLSLATRTKEGDFIVIRVLACLTVLFIGFISSSLLLRGTTQSASLTNANIEIVDYPKTQQQESLQILSVKTKISDRDNDSMWIRTWTMTVKNLKARPIEFDALIEFRNRSGKIIITDKEPLLKIYARETAIFEGSRFMDPSTAQQVSKITAKLKF